MSTRFYWLALLLGNALLWSACASIPPERYGITDVRFEGNEAMDGDALEACLSTYERSRVDVQLGQFGLPNCGEPPFHGHPARIRLWRWPWTEWPLYDELVLQHDIERITRWYEARGFVDAHVVEVRFEPTEAEISDEVPTQAECRDGDTDEGCRVSLVIVVDEGVPVLIDSVSVAGAEDLPRELAAQLEERMTLEVGARFDEYDYERAKASMQRALIGASYARAEVTGQVQIDRTHHTAVVSLQVAPGPPCVFGGLVLEGEADLPREPILAATAIDAGEPFSTAALQEAQQAVYDLRAFSAVTIEPIIPSSGNQIDVHIEVTPAPRSRFALGGGIESGIVQRGVVEEAEQAPQWDVHLLGTWEHRNLFGGLRQLRIEERPQLVATSEFPTVEEFQPANTVVLELTQPAFLEARTSLIFDSQWDLGPDPFLEVFRHQVDGGLRLERNLFDQHLHASLGLHESLYFVPDPADEAVVASSDLLYLEQSLRLDLRNDPVRVREGLLASVAVDEAGYFLPSSWSYVRVVPDVRGYVPLPWGMSLALRFALGAILLSEADPRLDDLSQELGPTSRRLRGGGATSNRGFLPGELGDGPQGGLRRWLAAIELRFPLTRDFFLCLFGDSGDVSSTPRFRFDHPQLSVGLGFRLLTLVGPVRLDFGWRVPDVQVLAEVDERDPGGRLGRIDLWLFEFPGAINLTLGDSF